MWGCVVKRVVSRKLPTLYLATNVALDFDIYSPVCTNGYFNEQWFLRYSNKPRTQDLCYSSCALRAMGRPHATKNTDKILSTHLFNVISIIGYLIIVT